MSRRIRSTLSCYLARKVLVASLEALLLVGAVYVAVDFVELRSLTGVGDGHLILSYPLKLPWLAGLLMPLGLVLGVQITTASLKKGGEWDALTSSGISPLFLVSRLLAPTALAIGVSAALSLFIGPAALAAWETKLCPSDVGDKKDLSRGEWVRTGRVFVRTADSNNRSTVIVRDESGLPTALYRLSLDLPAGAPSSTWKRSAGWGREAAPREVALSAGRIRAPMEDSFASVLPGATLTLFELDSKIEDQKSLGRVASFLEAERALRFAMVAACLVLPLSMAAFSMRSREHRASRLVGMGLASAVIYWMMASLAWNGAALGLISPLWLFAAVPTLYFAVSALLVVAFSSRSLFSALRRLP